VTVNFSENVNGISGSSAVVGLFDFTTSSVGTPVPGAWACFNSTNVSTSCATGNVRHAKFTPSSALTPTTQYVVALNPEHSLGVRDLAGNPFHRDLEFFFTSS
jgi:hypothetical protein